MFFNIIILFMLASVVNGIIKPTGINATEVRSTSFTITWNTQPSTWYKLSVVTGSRSVVNLTNSEDVIVDPRILYKVNRTTSGMTLQPDQPYHITLFAINAHNSIDYSYTTYDITTASPAPIEVRIDSVGSTQFTVYWQHRNNSVMWYNVRRTWLNGRNRMTKSVDVSKSYLTIDDLTASTVYNVSVIAVYDSITFSDESKPATSSTKPVSPALPVLSQPTGPTADPSTMIKFNWNKPNGGDSIDNYTVEWKLSTATSYSSSATVVHVVGTTSYSYIIDNLIPGGSYNVRVTARNSAGYSYSGNIYVTIPGKPPKPALRQLSTYQPTATLYLNWTQIARNFEKYEVKIYLGSTPVIQHNTADDYLYVDNLEAGAAYSATVTYISGGSHEIESEKSDQARTNPPTPTNVTINKPLIGDGTTQVNITWNMPSSVFRVASYEIVVKPSNGSNIKIQYNTGSNNPSTTYMVGNLVPGESYTATVQAVSPSAAGAPATFSETSSTSNIYNTKPLRVNYKVMVAAHQIKLTWNHPDGFVDGFRIKLLSQKIDNKARELLEDINLNASITSYTFQDLNQSIEYKITMHSWVNVDSGRLYSAPTTWHYIRNTLLHTQGMISSTAKMDTTSTVGLIVGSAISLLVLILCILGIIIFCKKRRKKREMNSKSQNNRVDVITMSNQNEAFDENTKRFQDSYTTAVIDESSSKYSTKAMTNTKFSTLESCLPFRNFIIRIILLSKFNENMKLLRAIDHRPLNEEFKELKTVGSKEKHKVALKPESLKKNRYKKTIFPYDATRVKLATIEAEPGSDYINANFVPGYNDEKEFIATQGPLQSTKDDFWRMIWEQSSRNIVMLTQIYEVGKAKCTKYWPDDQTPFTVSNMNLQLTNESKSKDWTLREFNLNKDGESRVIHQFHYTAWPDHGVPNIVADLIKFVQYFRENIIKEANHTGPITVHCSAGVGRTGTFIAIDHLLQRMKEHSDVDIYGIVCEMRKHRMFLVQTKEQYILLYKMVEEWIKHNYDETGPVYENTTTPGSLYGNI